MDWYKDRVKLLQQWENRKEGGERSDKSGMRLMIMSDRRIGRNELWINRERGIEEFLDMVWRLRKKGYKIGDRLETEMNRWGYVGRIKDRGESKREALSKMEAIYNVQRRNTPMEVRSKDRDDEILKKYSKRELGEDWKIPIELIWEYDAQFYAWINSINYAWESRVGYWRFAAYVREAKGWLDDKTTIEDFYDYEGRTAYVSNEIRRCRRNSLYWLDKYFIYKDDASVSGFSKYHSEEAQQVFSFLVDSGYDLLIGKARQIWFTTTAFGLALKDVSLNYSTFIKLITSDDKKAEETFEEKVKGPFYGMPWYIKPSGGADGDTKKELVFYRDKKSQEGRSSKIVIENPSTTAVNAGSPKKVFIDEVGIWTRVSLFRTIENWKPTSERYDHNLKKRVKRGQLIGWGTSDMKNSPEFQSIFRNAITQWDRRSFRRNLVPVFFSCMARPGYTEQEYQEGFKVAYATEGPDREDAIREFHQANPKKIADMFLDTGNTLIPMVRIIANLNRIDELWSKKKHKYGYFEPIFDLNKPLVGDELSDVPFVPIGSRFIVCEDIADKRITTCIYDEPENGYRMRYYKGTDPIQNSTGRSRFASSIFDLKEKRMCAIMNHRDANHRYDFLQSLLLQLYYGKDIKDLVENNIGQSYIDFVTKLGYHKNLVYNIELEKLLQSPGGNLVGINKKGNTARTIINRLVDMCDLYADGLNIPVFWEQMKTFVNKPSSTNDQRYAPDDLRFNFDDAIDCSVYSYINAMSYGERRIIEPAKVDKIVEVGISDAEREWLHNKDIIIHGRLLR